MSRLKRVLRSSPRLLIVVAAAATVAGCAVVPVGGYPPVGPAVVLPVPGVVVAPGPVIGRHGHWHRWHG